MEITKALHTDHVELKKLIKRVSKSEDGAERKQLFTQFAQLLTRHSKAEEKVVYDALIGPVWKNSRNQGTKAIPSTCSLKPSSRS